MEIERRTIEQNLALQLSESDAIYLNLPDREALFYGVQDFCRDTEGFTVTEIDHQQEELTLSSSSNPLIDPRIEISIQEAEFKQGFLQNALSVLTMFAIVGEKYHDPRYVGLTPTYVSKLLTKILPLNIQEIQTLGKMLELRNEKIGNLPNTDEIEQALHTEQPIQSLLENLTTHQLVTSTNDAWQVNF